MQSQFLLWLGDSSLWFPLLLFTENESEVRRDRFTWQSDTSGALFLVTEVSSVHSLSIPFKDVFVKASSLEVLGGIKTDEVKLSPVDSLFTQVCEVAIKAARNC